jgi:hypothetical protein
VIFAKERAAIVDATGTARDGINVALVVASVAVAIAAVALVVAVNNG